MVSAHLCAQLCTLVPSSVRSCAIHWQAVHRTLTVITNLHQRKYQMMDKK